MKTSDKYKWELVPYFNSSNRESSKLSSRHIYGKFLTYIDNEDFVGANLAKKMLERGSLNNSQFEECYTNACSNEGFAALENDFYNTPK